MKPDANPVLSPALSRKEKKRANHHAWYERNGAALNARRKAAYEARQPRVSPELLDHLRKNPTHSFGLDDVACVDCLRLGPFEAVVCLECGRHGLKQTAIHVREKHGLSWRDYQENWVLSRKRSGASPEYHAKRSRLSSDPENLRRLKQLSFTPETARRANLGRRHTLREKRKMPNRAAPPQTKLSRRLGPRRAYPSDWSIASRRLAGVKTKQIATELHVSVSYVNECCRAMGLPSKAAFFWRGEPVGDRHLQSLLRESDSTLKSMTARLDVKPYRIRAARRRGEALPFDLGRKIKALLQELELRRPQRQRLRAYEKEEIAWKARALRSEMDRLRAELAKEPARGVEAVLCQLAREGRVALLFRWGREFMGQFTEPGRTARANAKALADTLSRTTEVTHEFLAEVYGVSTETIRRSAQLEESNAHLALQQRRVLVDLLVAFGEELWIPTRELLARLRALGLAPWMRTRSARELATILRPIGMEPRNQRRGAQVLKGYRREDLKAYTTKEAAQKLGVAIITLKQYISRRTVPVPPLVRRRGVRGRGSVRVWADVDIASAQATLDSRSAGHRLAL